MKGKRVKVGWMVVCLGIAGCVIAGVVGEVVGERLHGIGTIAGLLSFVLLVGGVVMLVAYRYERVVPQAEEAQTDALKNVCLRRHAGAVTNQLHPGEVVQGALGCVHRVPWWQVAGLVCSGIGIIWAVWILQRIHYLVLTERRLLVVQFPMTSNPNPRRVWSFDKGSQCDLRVRWSGVWGWTVDVTCPSHSFALRLSGLRAQIRSRRSAEPTGDQWRQFKGAWEAFFSAGA